MSLFDRQDVYWPCSLLQLVESPSVPCRVPSRIQYCHAQARMSMWGVREPWESSHWVLGFFVFSSQIYPCFPRDSWFWWCRKQSHLRGSWWLEVRVHFVRGAWWDPWRSGWRRGRRFFWSSSLSWNPRPNQVYRQCRFSRGRGWPKANTLWG